MVFELSYLSWYPRTGGQNCYWQWRQRPRKTGLRGAMCRCFWVRCRALRAMVFVHYELCHPRLAVSAHRCICSLPRNSTHTQQSTDSVRPNTAQPTNVTVSKPIQETQSMSQPAFAPTTRNSTWSCDCQCILRPSYTQSQNQKWLGRSVLV